MADYNQIFLGQDGNKILAGFPDNFAKHFDWCMVPMTSDILLANKKTNIPKTIYLKTDFLPQFVNTIFPNINSEFILTTAASDYSPEINFNREYNLLINDQRVKHWYMNNMRYKHEKAFSLPAGFAAGTFWENSTVRDHKKSDDFFINVWNSANRDNKIDKVFCSFRNRPGNVCGSDMVIRPQIWDVIKNSNSDIFDIYEPDSLGFEEFVKKVTEYKYILIPHGNGMDPSPSLWISLICKTIPVIYKTPNVVDMFLERNSVIFFEKFEEILDKNIYTEKEQIDFDFLTCEYWANKIKSKI
jgi:hypothetical protein